MEPAWIKEGHPPKNSRLVVSVSGGKDSVAVCLHLRDLGYSSSDFDRVFLDTGWEDAASYEYLDSLESKIGKIDRINWSVKLSPEREEIAEKYEKRLGHRSAMIREILKHLRYYKIFDVSIWKSALVYQKAENGTDQIISHRL